MSQRTMRAGVHYSVTITTQGLTVSQSCSSQYNRRGSSRDVRVVVLDMDVEITDVRKQYRHTPGYTFCVYN